MSLRATRSVLVALLVASCDGTSDPGPIYTEIQQGQGPCDQGVNLSIEGKQYFVPLTVLPRTAVAIDGAQREAIVLTELLPASLLQPYSFDGKFTTAQLRALYDCRLSAEAGGAELTVAPGSMESGHLLVHGRSVHLAEAGAQKVDGVCRVEALRRMLVTRGTVSKVVHVADLPTEPYVDQGSQTTAVTFKDIVGASGQLAANETPTQFDYRVVSVDYLDRRDKAVRFPWGHHHLIDLRWVGAIARTKSIDTTGDLKPGAPYNGVASSGWSSAKHVLEVIMDAAPDPAHTVTGPDGPLTDPATCDGCHRVGGGVVIPVTCTQCHPR